MSQELVEIACEIKHETDSAYLISDGTREAWIPKSQIASEEEDAGVLVLNIPEWLAMEKELI